MGSAIRVCELSKEFGNGKARLLAVDNISFDVAEGEILAFLGPNGAGKTTAIKMLCNLIQPTRGSIWIKGHELAVDPRRALEAVGAVLEGSRNVYWRLTAAENLSYFAHIRSRVSPDLPSRIDRLLAALDLVEKQKDTVQTLSRGMQQKVALACALVTNPQILLLDEPTLGLDLQSSLTIQREIRRLAKEEGKAILLTTHQMEIAQALADRVAIIDHGQLIALDTLKDLRNLFALDLYEIRLEGRLALDQASQLEAVYKAQFNIGESETALRVVCNDTFSLYDLIHGLRPCGLPILTVQRMEPDLGEIYLKLIQKKDDGRIDIGTQG